MQRVGSNAGRVSAQLQSLHLSGFNFPLDALLADQTDAVPPMPALAERYNLSERYSFLDTVQLLRRGGAKELGSLRYLGLRRASSNRPRRRRRSRRME